MDHWYQDGVFGRETLSVEHQRRVLADEGITNITLVPGEVHKNSWDNLDVVHYCLLDMDIPEPTRVAYDALKHKVKGYLLLHDVNGGHIPGLAQLYREVILPEGLFEEVEASTFMAVLRSKDL
jgi:hypothetical protein